MRTVYSDVADILLHRHICGKFANQDFAVEALARRASNSHEVSRAPEYSGEGQLEWSSVNGGGEVYFPYACAWAYLHLRPGLLPSLKLLRCHKDIQWWHGRGALLHHGKV